MRVRFSLDAPIIMNKFKAEIKLTDLQVRDIISKSLGVLPKDIVFYLREEGGDQRNDVYKVFGGVTIHKEIELENNRYDPFIR